jgi:alkylation response protein AidB-like acyl-CoA dehydrogenase
MHRTLFDDTHDQFRSAVRSFLEREAVPHRERWEEEGIVDRSLFEAAGSSGFLGMEIPEKYGGGGVHDFRFNVVLSEEIQQTGMNAAGLGLTLQNDICLPYFLHLTDDDQKQRWLPGICSGELITAVAMSEPGIGSDLASMTTSAIRDGDHYVVNGSKTFITNGINADLVITAVKTDPTQRHRGMSLLVMRAPAPRRS